MHNPSSCTLRCPPAFLSVSLVPITSTSPSVAKPLQFAILFDASPVPYESSGVLCLFGGAAFALASAGQSPRLGSRGAGLAVFRAVARFAAPVVCASVSQGGCRRSGWFDLVARQPLAWRGGFLGPPSSLPPQAICNPAP